MGMLAIKSFRDFHGHTTYMQSDISLLPLQLSVTIHGSKLE